MRGNPKEKEFYEPEKRSSMNLKIVLSCATAMTLSAVAGAADVLYVACDDSNASDEAVEGRDSFLEKRDPDWSPYPYHF